MHSRPAESMWNYSSTFQRPPLPPSSGNDDNNSILMQLVAQEDFIEFNYHRCFKSYTQICWLKFDNNNGHFSCRSTCISSCGTDWNPQTDTTYTAIWGIPQDSPPSQTCTTLVKDIDLRNWCHWSHLQCSKVREQS
jgi:hypothetical protein